MTRRLILGFALSFTLLAGIFVSDVDLTVPGVVSAQEGLIVMSKTPDQTLRDVKARGVKVLPAAQAARFIKEAGGRGGSAEFKCGKAACMCVGSKSCGDLVASNKCGSNFHCLKTNDGPSCVCEQ